MIGQNAFHNETEKRVSDVALLALFAVSLRPSSGWRLPDVHAAGGVIWRALPSRTNLWIDRRSKVVLVAAPISRGGAPLATIIAPFQGSQDSRHSALSPPCLGRCPRLEYCALSGPDSANTGHPTGITAAYRSFSQWPRVPVAPDGAVMPTARLANACFSLAKPPCCPFVSHISRVRSFM
jgi:hypothetical protein